MYPPLVRVSILHPGLRRLYAARREEDVQYGSVSHISVDELMWTRYSGVELQSEP